MKPLTVLLDMDGVIVDFVEHYLHLVEDFHGKVFSHDDVTQWDVERALGLSQDEAHVVHKALEAPRVAYHMHPYTGAVDAVHRISQHATVVFLTAHLKRSPTWVHDRDNWIKLFFGNVDTKVVYTHHKELVPGDVFVDDKPENVLSWKRAHPFGTAILWSMPWNKEHWLGDSDIIRLEAFEQLISLVEYKAKKRSREGALAKSSGAQGV